jgi:AraC-like DNA-binding protein/mannose-6-phosphate isomerase-like protein (cupin superfamily)
MNSTRYADSAETPTRLLFAGIHRRAKNVREHAHECIEVILIRQGTCEVHVDDQTLTAHPGDIIAIPAHQVHDQISDGYIDTVYCGFTAPPTLICSKPHVIALPDISFVEQSMLLLSSVSLSQTQAAPEAANLVMEAILEQLQQQHVLHQELEETPPLLRIILRYINDHLDNHITVETLAEHTRMSSSNLHLLFRTHLKTSPMRYLHDQRMKAARSALLTPYLSVKEVAVICGYPDVNHFVRTFRKTHGLPPGQWRKQQEVTL